MAAAFPGACDGALHDDRKQEGWVQALHSVLERLRIDSCPICDRDYSELGKGSLEAKIRNELVQIDTDLENRRRREGQRAELGVRLAELEQETKAWQARMDRAPAEEAQSRLSRLSELKSHLDWQASRSASGKALGSEVFALSNQYPLNSKPLPPTQDAGRPGTARWNSECFDRGRPTRGREPRNAL